MDDVVDVEPLNLGIIGVSEGNGHPYSFASVVNGYDSAGFEASEWGVIHDYLREKDDSEFGFPGVSVTHAWTQDDDETETLCRAARIPNAVSRREEFLEEVDGVIIARDDHETHVEMARPFLESGCPVFLDKPMAIDPEDVGWLTPHLQDGSLMSCSGMRFARSLDGARANIESYGPVKLVHGAILKDWERYAPHLLDATFNVLDVRPTAVSTVEADHTAASIELENGGVVRIDTLGDVEDAFDLSIYGVNKRTTHNLSDNFTAFRRTLWRFIESIRTGEPAIPPEETLKVIRTLYAGIVSRSESRTVKLNEIPF